MSDTKKTTQGKVTVKRDEQNPEPMELIAASIIEVAEAVKKINNSRLHPKVIKLLIKDMTGIPLSTIEQVLNAAASLEKTFIKQK